MGRYLAAAIPTKIGIRNRTDFYALKEVDIFKDKDLILNKLSEYIDTNFYDISYEEDMLCLELNQEKTNKYLEEFLEEINDILDLSDYLFYMLFKEDTEIKLNSIFLKVNEERECYLTRKNSNKYIEEESACFDGAPWAFDLDNKFYKSIRLSINAINLWVEIDKFECEDESKMLQLLNKFSKSYFKSELSKIMMFHITE